MLSERLICCLEKQGVNYADITVKDNIRVLKNWYVVSCKWKI